MYNTGELEWGEDGIGMHDSLSFEQMTPAEQNDFIELHGQRKFRYDNTGIGNALGSEFSFFYDPVATWNGWISAELSLSNRRDRKGESWYDFRYHRPWIINWVN